MAIRTINLYAKSSLGPFIEGVLLRIVTTSMVLVTEGTTDVNGKLGPLLLEDGTYLVAAHKSGCVFPAGTSLVVSADGAYDIIGTVSTLPTATDPNRCRVYGSFCDPKGINHTKGWLNFTPVVPGLVVGNKSIHGVATALPNNGIIDIELYRDTYYLVTMPWPFPKSPWKGTAALYPRTIHTLAVSYMCPIRAV